MQFLFFCTAVIRAVDKFQGLLRMSIAARRQRSPARRQRGAAGDPVGVPRRHAHRHLRADREGAAPRRPSTAACSTSASRCCPSCRATPATATARRRSPSPATSSSSARCRLEPEHRLPGDVPERGRGRIAGLHGDRAREHAPAKGTGASARRVARAAEEDRQAAQADHLQRQRLLGRSGRRKPASAAC